jgi:hypothetical protein
MANPTTNYGFVMPTPTDLVTDLPADFGVFGQAVDTQMLTNANAAISKSIVDAKGDLIAATAADTVSRLAVGTNGQVLVADSTAATGLAWATAAGGGKVLQVVFGSHATQVNNSTNTYADTGLTATITPTLNTSKVLVLGVINGVIRVGGGTGGSVGTKWFRGATELALSSYYATYTATSTTLDVGSVAINYLDSPATTSATTYKAQFASLGNAAYVGVQDGSALSTIVLMEIGA